MKIVISVVLAFFLIGCGEDDLTELQNTEPKQIVQNADEEIVAENADQAIVVQNGDEEVVVENQEEPTEMGIVDDVVVAESSVKDGATIYKVCSSCHGLNAEKSALGKSKVIQGWSAGEVSEALNGYKDGSYGGTMKEVMKGQVGKLSEEDIELVSQYISTL